jgi:hypothetical protein
MKHVAFGNTLRWNNCPYAGFHLKQSVSFQQRKNRCSSKSSCTQGLIHW